MALSKKQAEFMRAPLPRLTIVEGCISSGKTFICNHKAIKHILENYTGKGLIFFVGKTISTLALNVLSPLAEIYGDDFTYSKSSKQAMLCGIKINLEGCNDIRAEHKIRGTTAEFIYGDEITLWNLPFLTRCMGSLRVPNACFLGTTNPDSPDNFVYENYLEPERKKEVGVWNPKFTMDDNPSLTEQYKDDMNKIYQGVLHDRFIKGLWVRAEGVIYRKFADDSKQFIVSELPNPKDIMYVKIGVDFGGNGSASCFIATGFSLKFKSVITLFEEFREAATEEPETLTAAFVSFVNHVKRHYPNTIAAYCDSTESILIRGFRTAIARAHIPIKVLNARKGEINDRIRLVTSLMGQERYCVHKDCKHLIKSFQEAVWDEKSIEDKRRDDGSYEVDPLDAFEYSIESDGEYLQRMR